MARAGASVIVNDLDGSIKGDDDADVSPAQQVVDEIKKLGGKAVVDGHSVTDWAGAQAMVQKAKRRPIRHGEYSAA
jgi:hypothetical protein